MKNDARNANVIQRLATQVASLNLESTQLGVDLELEQAAHQETKTELQAALARIQELEASE